MRPWLQFFRIVNLPTVPGDVLVGAAVAGYGRLGFVVATCLASVFLYLFGLADNDIVGAKTDGADRPIPRGEISLGAARIARGLCLFAAMIVGALGNLPPAWWIVAFALACACVVYNRTKWSVVMGLCRGLNVACGGAVALATPSIPLLVLVAVWTLSFVALTKYSEGEEAAPAKRRRVGLLIGGVVYLQLAVLLVAFQLSPTVVTRNLLLGGAALLILLRLLKRVFPKVSAS